ncbi:MAG: hypothetical protein ACLR8U_00280 [Oscillospiraceae bacterium]
MSARQNGMRRDYVRSVLVCMSGTAHYDARPASGGSPLISAAVVLRYCDHQHKLHSVQLQKPDPRPHNGRQGSGRAACLGSRFGAGLYTLAALGFAAILACLSWLPAFET